MVVVSHSCSKRGKEKTHFQELSLPVEESRETATRWYVILSFFCGCHVHVIRTVLYCIGPPDSMREHVVAAAHAMMEGDWKMCNEYILSIKVCEKYKCCGVHYVVCSCYFSSCL